MNDIFKEVYKSKKYSSMDEAIVKRICEEISKKYPKKKEAIKAAKNQLHIIYESFIESDCYKRARKILEENGNNISRNIALELMSLHASTRERIKIINEVYDFLSKYIELDSVVIDVGCGFNPFAIVFLSNVPKVYRAFDINEESVSILNLCFSQLDFYAKILDAVTDVPKEHADVMLLFKLLPLLNQQKKGRAFEFIALADFSIAIVSFPIKSLSGREKGMLESYSNYFEQGLPNTCSIIEKKVVDNELFYVIKKD